MPGEILSFLAGKIWRRIRFAAFYASVALAVLAYYQHSERANRARLDSEYYLLEPPTSINQLAKDPLQAAGDISAPLSHWWLYKDYASREDCEHSKAAMVSAGVSQSAAYRCLPATTPRIAMLQCPPSKGSKA